MKVDIFICTFRRDFPYLRYCLRSIRKFATGFHNVVILVPDQDYEALIELVRPFEDDRHDIRCYCGSEWPNKGMMWHEAQILRADEWCSQADYIAHMDSDCVFYAPVTPDTFFRNGKPLLRYELYEDIAKISPGSLRWKACVEAAIPFVSDRDFMRGHPEVYHRGLYAITREAIAKHTGIPCDFHIRAQKNDFPQTFCEFITLGTVAFNLTQNEYYLWDMQHPQDDDHAVNNYPVFQAWSHSLPDVVANLWWKGVQQPIKPIDVFTEIGLV